MRIQAALTAFTIVGLVLFVAQTGAYAAGPVNAPVVAAVDSVVGASASAPVQLVKFGHSGFYGSFGYGPYSYGPWNYGGIYSGYNGPYSSYGYGGQGYYEEGNKTCVWNGYQYSCYSTR